jgi:hypothetical protein
MSAGSYLAPKKEEGGRRKKEGGRRKEEERHRQHIADHRVAVRQRTTCT